MAAQCPLPWYYLAVFGLLWVGLALHTSLSMRRHGRRWWVWFLVSVFLTVTYPGLRLILSIRNPSTTSPVRHVAETGLFIPGLYNESIAVGSPLTLEIALTVTVLRGSGFGGGAGSRLSV